MGHSTIWTLEKRNISCFLPKIEPQFLIVTQPVAKSLHLLKQRLHTFFKSCGYEDSSCYFISDLTFFHVHVVQLVRNVMAHGQKPDFVFPQNGRVHLNRWGRQFSRLLAAEVCASAWVMLDRPHSDVAWEYWLPTPFASFSFTSPPVRHRVPPGSERALNVKTLFWKTVWWTAMFHM